MTIAPIVHPPIPLSPPPEVSRELVRVDMSLLSKRGEPEEDPRLLLKSLPAKAATTAPPLRDVSRVR